MADGGKSAKLPGEMKVDPAADTITAIEAKVAAFKSDDPKVEIDYPEASIRFARQVVLTFVRDPNRDVRAVRATTTVSWKLNVRGNPERRISMELVLHGRWP